MMSSQNKKINYFQLFKYTVYVAVLLNVAFFLNKDLAALMHRFADNFTWDKLIQAFTSTIDTAAWAILLILFELETYVLSEEQLKGNLKWILRSIRGFCYWAVVYSLIGYVDNYLWLQHFSSTDLSNLCEATASSFMKELDEFETISPKNCKELAKTNEFLLYVGKSILTDSYYYEETIRLVIVDIINAITWILVVVILEIDVWWQLKNRFIGKVFQFSKCIKNFLYIVLFFAAVYWGIFGEFLEFWDAFLWIIAFVFIEMNLFNWQREIKIKNIKNG